MLGKGKFSYSNFKFDVKGRINWQDQIKFSPYFLFTGDLSSWNLEIYLKNSSLKYNNYMFRISDLNLRTDSNRNIEGHIFLIDGEQFAYIGLNGNWDEWKLTFWGENINVLGEKIKVIKVNLDSSFSGDFNIKVGDYLLKSDFGLSLDSKFINLKNFYFDKYYLGDIKLSLENNILNIDGQILQGFVRGYYKIGESGNLDFSDIRFGDLKVSGTVNIRKDGLIFKIPKLNFSGLDLENIQCKLDFEEPNHVKEFSVEMPFNIRVYGDFNLESGYVKSLLYIKMKEKEIGFLNLKGDFEKLSFIGNIFAGSVEGYYDFKENSAILDVKNLSLSEIDSNFYGNLEDFSATFKEGFLSFKGNSTKMGFKGNSIENVSFKGSYKEDLKFNLTASYSMFDFSLNGTFNFRGGNRFTLSLRPKEGNFNEVLSKVLSLDFIGEVDKDFKNIRLTLNKDDIKFLKSGNINIDVQNSVLMGNVIVGERGEINLKLGFDGNGLVNLKDISLSLLEDLDISGFEGSISGLLRFEKWDIPDFELDAVNLRIKNFNEKSINLSLKGVKDRNGYLLSGGISKLSEKPAKISGVFGPNAFNLQISFTDLKFLEDFISKDLIAEGDVKSGVLRLDVDGDLNNINLYGKLTWNNPLVFKYVKDKIYGGNFQLNYSNGELKLTDLEINAFSSKLKIYGVISPLFNLYGNVSSLCLSSPDIGNGYLAGDFKITKDKDIYTINGTLKVSNSHIYFPKNTNISLNNFKLNLPLSLDLELKLEDNILFSDPGLLYLYLTGDVFIKGNINMPLLDGKIEFVNGSINILGNDFRVDDGYIKFPGLSFNENIWEVSASKIIQGYNVILKGVSFMGNSSFIFSSDPPLSLREILFLLLGQKNLPIVKEENWTLSTILESIPQGVEGVVSSAFSSYILSPLLSEFEKILKMDRIKVEYTLEGLIPRWKSISFERVLFSNLSLNVVYYLEGDNLWSTQLTYKFNENLYFKLYTSPKTEFSFSFEYGTQF